MHGRRKSHPIVGSIGRIEFAAGKHDGASQKCGAGVPVHTKHFNTALTIAEHDDRRRIFGGCCCAIGIEIERSQWNLASLVDGMNRDAYAAAPFDS